MNTEKNTTNISNKETSSQIKIVWLLHFLWNIFSGGILGTLLVIWYLLINNDLEEKTKAVIYDIINFNLTFIILLAIAFISMFILIWFVLLPIWAIIWFVLLIIGFIKHLAWDRYEYPMTFTFLK